MRPDRPVVSDKAPNASKENSAELVNAKNNTHIPPARDTRHALATKSLNSFSASSAPANPRVRSFNEISPENGVPKLVSKRSKLDKLDKLVPTLEFDESAERSESSDYESEEDLWNNGEKIMKIKHTDDGSLTGISFEKRGPFMVAPRSSLQWSMTDPSIDFENLELDSIPL